MMAAMGRLGWPPDIFWNASLMELRMALEGRFPRPPGQALDSADIDHLQAVMANAQHNDGVKIW